LGRFLFFAGGLVVGLRLPDLGFDLGQLGLEGTRKRTHQSEFGFRHFPGGRLLLDLFLKPGDLL
jgi:hypothetical protein